MHPSWRPFWLAALRRELHRELWVAALVAVALSVATVVTSRQPASTPAQPDAGTVIAAAPDTSGEQLTVGEPTAQPTQPEPFHAYHNMVPGLFYPIAYLQRNPRRWVGKTVQIEGGLFDTCCIPEGSLLALPPPFIWTIREVDPSTTVPFALLDDDGNTAAGVLPLAPGVPLPWAATNGSGTGGSYRVHLAWWSNCGELGFGKNACLVADHIQKLHD